MRVHELTVMIGTDQPDALARFYGEILGLTRVERFADPVFEAAGGFIRILDHSEISGPTVEPARVQINLFVDDVAAEFARIITARRRRPAPANPRILGRPGRHPPRPRRQPRPAAGDALAGCTEKVHRDPLFLSPRFAGDEMLAGELSEGGEARADLR